METSRRRFLGMGAAAVGGAVAATVLPPTIAQAAAIAPNRRTGTIRDVEHVVILMQENRSFDHYFGTLRGVRGFGDPRPHVLPNGRPVWEQPPVKTVTDEYHSRGLPADAPHVLPWSLNEARTSEYIAGTNHGWSSGHLAWNEGRWDQWVDQKQDVLTMAHLNLDEIPYHAALAEAFTIGDAYHCSTHADTAPNRVYLWSGTIDPQNRLGSAPNGPGLGERDGFVNGYTWTTYPERLQKAGVSWKVYQGGSGIPGTPTDNFTDNSLEFFAKYQDGGKPADTELGRLGAGQHTLKEFAADVTGGTLPQVSWIVTPYQYSEHPSASPTDGAKYIDMVLSALVADPEVWSKTVFIINYDENDGLFDHVVAPMPPVVNKPGTDGLVSASLSDSLADEILDLDKHPEEMGPLIPGADPGGLQPIGLGPRVPLLIVSPWTTGGWVCSEVFDHTSVLRFLERRFGVEEPNISAWRRSLCGDLTSAFDFSRNPQKPSVPPVPAPIAGAGAPFTVALPQTMPVQQSGVRPARALPYDFAVSDDGISASDGVTLRFDNRGRAGAYFYVRNGRRPEDAPRRYTVASRDAVRDSWSPELCTDGGYDLLVTGANGYLAHLTGSLDDSLGVALSARRNEIDLRFTGDGTPRRLKVVNTYQRSGRGREQTVSLRRGQRHLDWSVAATSGWYELVVTDLDRPEFTRRFAGRIENGRPGYSDPGPAIR